MNKHIGFLIFILLVTLTFSIQFSSVYEGMTDSSSTQMLTVSDISGINLALSDYYSNTEATCKTAVSAIQKLNIPNIVIKNDLSYCAIIDNISASNQNNPQLNDLINTCYGNKYTEVLNLLNEIENGTTYQTNSNFSSYINNLGNSPSISGSKTTAGIIQKYVGGAEMVNQSQDAATAAMAAVSGTTSPAITTTVPVGTTSTRAATTATTSAAPSSNK